MDCSPRICVFLSLVTVRSILVSVIFPRLIRDSQFITLPNSLAFLACYFVLSKRASTAYSYGSGLDYHDQSTSTRSLER